MQRTDAIDRIGLGISRYGLVGLLLLWGSFKFFAFEAAAILDFGVPRASSA